MTDYGAYVDQSAAHVLANHEILMAAPSAARLTSFYPSPAESTNTIAQAVCNSGQLFIQANSKAIPGSSDFQVSTPNIMDTPMLTMTIVIPALDLGANPDRANTFVGTYHEGWGFDIIERLEISFANSNISNLQILLLIRHSYYILSPKLRFIKCWCFRF